MVILAFRTFDTGQPFSAASIEIRAAEIEAALRAAQFAAVIFELGGAVRTEAVRVGRRFSVVAYRLRFISVSVLHRSASVLQRA